MTYLSALASGDAAGALAVTALPGDEFDEIETAYASATERVTEARVLNTTDRTDSSLVTVSYLLAGTEVTPTLELVERESGWQIINGLAAVTPLTSLGDAVGIGTRVVSAGAPLWLLPGRYDIEALPRGIVAGSATIDVAPGIDAEVTLAASVSADATAAAQTQLDAYADACIETAPAPPENCGIRVPWAADLATATSFAYRVDQRPVVSVSADGRTFAATGGVIVATVSGTTREGAPASFTYRADDWALRGTVSFQGNEMVLAVG